MLGPEQQSRPGGGSGTAESAVAARHQLNEKLRSAHQVDAPVDGHVHLGPAEALDGCPDCHGAVQRFARHPQGLGTLEETPLSINTHDQPYSPRLPGPGIFSLAMDTYARNQREARR